MKKQNIIRCNVVEYRQGYIEIQNEIHEGCINVEAWQINPAIDISNLELKDEKIADDDIISNTEIELSLDNAEKLIWLLSEAISNVQTKEST